MTAEAGEPPPPGAAPDAGSGVAPQSAPAVGSGSARAPAGLLDTSAVVDLDRVDVLLLPRELAICAVTLAELAAGPAATTDVTERARRQDRLQRAEAAFDPLPFGVEAARAYGRVAAAVAASGRPPRRRFADLLIAAVAVAESLPLVTRNADAFAGLSQLVRIVEV